ncbi:MAG: cytochrome c [Telmatospirillum sp.]|nr:cytochrome c [Telmatospirillum sp.]
MRANARLGFIVALAGVLFLAARPADAAGPAAGDAKRGEYLFAAGGCAGCHTDVKNGGQLLAGGRELKTPFGSFYGPNITAHPTAGIGKWSDDDFVRALRLGRRPDGAHYFPVFPYTSFTKMTDQDMVDLKAYIFALPTSDKPNRAHDIGFPFNLRPLQFGWKLLNFAPGAFVADPAKSAEINRGAYLAQALGHCAECHSPRNAMGGLKRDMLYAGDRAHPGGGRVPNITPDRDTGIGKWSPADYQDLLSMGMTPAGDFVGGDMGEVVKNSTGPLTPADRSAMVAYLRQLPAIANRISGQAP